MIRESDEECLALIATIRDRAQRLVIDGTHARMYGTHSETERLLGNLEARIADLARLHSRDSRELRELADICAERDGYRTENARLRGQLAELGHEFVKLTGEIERLNAVCVIKDEEIASLRRAPKDAEPEQPTTIGEPASPEVCEEFGRAQREDTQEPEDAKAPWCCNQHRQRARESAAIDRLVFDRSPNIASFTSDELPRAQASQGWVDPETVALRHTTRLATPEERAERDRLVEKRRNEEDAAIRYRDIIREEVAKATAESSREIAVQLIALAERLAAVELHEAANQPGEPSFRLRTVLREEVRKEVEQELAPVCRAITEVEESIFKASAEIGEARRFAGNIREEVAAEVERQLGEWQEAKASPEIRTWLDNVQHELDKLRVALEAEAS